MVQYQPVHSACVTCNSAALLDVLEDRVCHYVVTRVVQVQPGQQVQQEHRASPVQALPPVVPQVSALALQVSSTPTISLLCI